MNWLRFARLDVVPKPRRKLHRDELGRWYSSDGCLDLGALVGSLQRLDWTEQLREPQKYVLDWI